MLKMISWNVNGLRACLDKGFREFVKCVDADMICLQETKLSKGQLQLELDGYHLYICEAVYSIIYKGLDAKEVLTKLFLRPVKFEF